MHAPQYADAEEEAAAGAASSCRRAAALLAHHGFDCGVGGGEGGGDEGGSGGEDDMQSAEPGAGERARHNGPAARGRGGGELDRRLWRAAVSRLSAERWARPAFGVRDGFLARRRSSSVSHERLHQACGADGDEGCTRRGRTGREALPQPVTSIPSFNPPSLDLRPFLASSVSLPLPPPPPSLPP